MLTTIQDAVLPLLPAKRKRSQSGWISFNAPCCQHNGESADTRGRGGVMTNVDGGISYHCFNCNFKTSYVPGRPLTFKFRKWLNWLGADPNEVKRLVIEAIRIKDLVAPEAIKDEPEHEISFEPRKLPEEARSFFELLDFYILNDGYNVPEHLDNAVTYCQARKIDLHKYDFYWTPEVEHKLDRRVIVPFTWKGQTVGYTARTFVDGVKPKYHSNHPAHFVFNMDKQTLDKKFVIVCEGPFDAMSVDGVAVLTNEISEQQAEIIESLGREVIVVPDFDSAGSKMIRDAIEYGWSVAFPVWSEDCKDINEAVVKYGKLFVLKSILDSRDSNPLKIKLRAKK
jgi:hypothetical protein